MDSLTRRSTRLRSEADRLRSIADQTASLRPSLDQAEGDSRQGEARAEEALRSADSRQREAEAEQHRWTARQEALSQALDQARARAGAERLSDVAGVVGTLMELVHVDDGYESAFEAAAGEVLAAVIVDGVESARRGLAQLHRLARAGAVVALPDLVAEPGLDPSRVPPGTSPLRTRVRARLPNVNALLDQLLRDVVVTDAGWQHAIDVAISRPDLVVVTLSGDRCSRGLWQLGRRRGRSNWCRSRARRGGKRRSPRPQRAEAEMVLQEARHAGGGRLGAGGCRPAAAVEEAATRQRLAAEGLERVRVDLADNDTELAAVRTQSLELSQRHARELERISELEAMLPELQRLAAVEAERAAAEKAARSRLAEQAARLASRRRELEVRAAGLEERRTMTARRLREVEERLRHNVAERDQAGARREKAQQAAEATDRLLGFVRGREEAVNAALSRLREARRAETDAIKARTDRLEQLRRQRSAAERQLAEIRERTSRVELDETESRLRLEGLTDSIRRDLDCEPESVRGARLPGASGRDQRHQPARQNWNGSSGSWDRSTRWPWKSTQPFRSAISSSNRSSRTCAAPDASWPRSSEPSTARSSRSSGRRTPTWPRISRHSFATLFPGGEGQLRLTDPDHLLDSGVEVEARPSGKNLRRLSLLSGGERSLAAMAFLFAVFRARPSPFYMLDEVEAALDDVNLHRFLDLMHEFRDEAQLLVVSHQKRTMEAADCLYGVTMAPGGSSRVVSERVSTPAG